MQRLNQPLNQRINQRINQLSSASTAVEGQPAAPYLQTMGQLLKQQVATPPAPREQLARARFGQYIQSARQYHELSRDALAVALGVEAAQVYGLEEGLLPTAQIDATLLAGLAHILDEDPMLLNQLLREEGYHRKPSPLLGQLPGWGWAILCLIAAYYVTLKATISAALVRVTDSCLQCGLNANLVNRLQASRLTLYATTGLVAFTFAFFSVLWIDDMRSSFAGFYFSAPTSSLALGQTAPLLRTTAEQRRNNVNANLRGAEPAFDSALSHVTVNLQAASPNAVAETYRISYAPNQPSYRNDRTAYITVDGAQIAIISLDVHISPPSQTRCSSAGRFDLCPV